MQLLIQCLDSAIAGLSLKQTSKLPADFQLWLPAMITSWFPAMQKEPGLKELSCPLYISNPIWAYK